MLAIEGMCKGYNSYPIQLVTPLWSVKQSLDISDTWSRIHMLEL